MFWTSLSGLHFANPSPSIDLDHADFLHHVEVFEDMWSLSLMYFGIQDSVLRRVNGRASVLM